MFALNHEKTAERSIERLLRSRLGHVTDLRGSDWLSESVLSNRVGLSGMASVVLIEFKSVFQLTSLLNVFVAVRMPL